MKAKKTQKFDGTESVDPEFEFHPERMVRVPRDKMRVANPGDTTPRHCKVRISLYVDADLLAHFKRKAKPPHAPRYQTQMNAALRQSMETERWPQKYEALLNDERFIEALAERLKAKAG